MTDSAGTMTIDGAEYPVPDSFKLGETRLIKQIAGLRISEIPEGMQLGDPDLLAALALIVMRRAGREVTLAELDEIDITAIDFTDAEPDVDPPGEAAGKAAGKSATRRKGSGGRSTGTSSA